tara:strand:+ start:735 stop:1703 length:969 start_codon:yes stop_codon:yes gene_type:complete
MNFIDYATVYVKAGDGGDGCIAFLREKFRPKGGPAGGDGGNGGSIIFKTDQNLSTLHDLSYNKKYYAKKGENGKGKNMHGKNGEDVLINVPIGTILKDSNSKKIIADLNKPNQRIVIAKGGNGGFGNARFKTQQNTAPRKANSGQLGQEFKLDLELKVLADVGLVGFPNAGKSTFISSISNAKPKIADYPFTTLVPNLGIVKFNDYKSCVIADIPGIIEGASDGKGLGIQFLKHIERTKILAFIVDVTSDDVKKEYNVLLKELEKYKKSLVEKPHFLILSKCDLLTDESNYKSKFKKIDVVEISSINRSGLEAAKKIIFDKI